MEFSFKFSSLSNFRQRWMKDEENTEVHRSLCAPIWLQHKPTLADGAWGRVQLRSVAFDDQISPAGCPRAGQHDGGL
ncbi:hypothetical protein V6N12_028557 [Hibiscus sabdariffa]|uniref:Uncharacterized protein n=1 Tax=Hibiscus sabdariffa TaxID=183260 RepID=A0ABR2F670_9ROSI